MQKLEVEDDLEFPKTRKHHSRTVIIKLDEDNIDRVEGDTSSKLEESKQSSFVQDLTSSVVIDSSLSNAQGKPKRARTRRCERIRRRNEKQLEQ